MTQSQTADHSAFSVASITLGQWHAGASRRGLAITIAAVVLMLHWAAPNFRPPEFSTPSKDSSPSLSSQTVSQQGNLPRALPRPLAFETAQPKPHRPDWLGGDKAASLHRGLDPAVPTVKSSGVSEIAHAGPASRPVHAFFARGPPA